MRNHDWKKTSLDGVLFPHTTQTCLSGRNIPDIFLIGFLLRRNLCVVLTVLLERPADLSGFADFDAHWL
jgi:hypothetical protein